MRILLWGVLLAVAVSLGAQERDISVVRVQRKVALVIGNAAYPQSPLKNPVNDATAMAGGLAAMKSDAEGTLIAFATGDNNVAADNPAESNGLFTKHLVAAIQRPGLSLD